MSEGKRLLKEAVATARAERRDDAREMFAGILRRRPTGRLLTETLFWLSELSRSGQERKRYLQALLREDPKHVRGRKRWRQLQAKAEGATAAAAEGSTKIKRIEAVAETAEAAVVIDLEKPMCPECGRRLFFMGTGRTLLCDYCQYKHELPLPPRQAIAELVQELNQVLLESTRQREAQDGESMGTRNLHDMIHRGKADLKAGNHDEAYFYFTSLLRTGTGTFRDRVEAWYGLSQICEDPAESHICLDHVLSIEPMHPEARRALAVLDGRLQTDEMIQTEWGVVDGEAETEAGQAERMVCPQCAGRMNYAADERQTLVCEFCGYETQMEVGEPVGRHMAEKDFAVAMATAKGHRAPLAMRTLQCETCAVDFLLAAETLSLTCPYCDSVYVTEAAETREIVPPDGVIPFKVAEDEAQKGLHDWLGEAKLAPTRVSPLVGIYLPVWTFDISGPLVWRALIPQNGREAEWKSGEYFVLHDDYLVPASDKLDKGLLPHLETFNYDELATYDARYLADWPAERYTRAVGDASLLARKEIMGEARRNPARLTGTNRAQQFTVGSRGGLAVETYKLILLPFWMVHYKVDDTFYDVIVNGQTGAVRGQKPQGLLGKLGSWLLGK